MPFSFKGHSFHFEKKRFEAETDEEQKKAKLDKFKFNQEGDSLFTKAIEAAAKFPNKTLPLQGVIDLEAKIIHLGALTPKDEEAIAFHEKPIFHHKQVGLFSQGQYSPRLRSYQERYSEGPTAHQQLLRHASQKQQVSADDANNKRGFALNIRVTQDKQVYITVDGNSLSINQTARYLRDLHLSGHELSEHEAKNEVLKASSVYSAFCESWVLDGIVQACGHIIDENIQNEKKAATFCSIM